MEMGELTWDEPQAITQFRHEQGWVTDATTEDTMAKDNLTGSYQTRGPIFASHSKVVHADTQVIIPLQLGAE